MSTITITMTITITITITITMTTVIEILKLILEQYLPKRGRILRVPLPKIIYIQIHKVSSAAKFEPLSVSHHPQ